MPILYMLTGFLLGAGMVLGYMTNVLREDIQLMEEYIAEVE